MPLDPAELESTSGAPTWLRAIVFLGVPSAIAIFLVWFLTVVVVAGQTQIESMLNQHVQSQQRQIFLLSLICRNTAQTDRERSQCDVELGR